MLIALFIGGISFRVLLTTNSTTDDIRTNNDNKISRKNKNKHYHYK